jgi:hypothetical protein
MDLVIARSEGIMSIDNQPLAIDTSALATNIEFVAYDCNGGAGNIEYSNALRVLDPFIDVVPYASFVNTWLTAAAAMLALPITLAQAKRVKIGLVDGIFNSKRQLPISYANQTWEATDQALMGMQAAVNGWDIAASISAGDATLAANINTMSLQVNLGAIASQPVATGTSDGQTFYLDGYGSIMYMYQISPNDTNGPWNVSSTNSPAWLTSVGGGGVSQQPSYSGSTTPITFQQTAGPNISWPPLNATTPVTMSMTSMRTLLANIQSRRASLQSTRLTKTNAVNLLTTIAAVIAYDATSNWPF